MDYKRKYKEAVNKIRNLLDDGEKNGFTIVTYKTDLESIFPELKELEDEKVRKEIVEYLKKNLRLEWATWLEKQGEQKSIEWDEYDEMYVSALIAIVRKEDATTPILRDTLTGWLRCLQGRFKKDKL